MSNASITVGMPIWGPGLADGAGHEALIGNLIRQATSMIAGVILLRAKSSFASPGHHQHASLQAEQRPTTATRPAHSSSGLKLIVSAWTGDHDLSEQMI